MQHILSAVMVVFLSLLSLVAQAEESQRPWAGPAIEFRLGRTLTEHEFSFVDNEQSTSFRFDDAATVSGLKVGWRFPLGNRLTLGPMLAYYGEGVSAAASGVYEPEAVSTSASYHETQAVTAGLQIGVDAGNGWFAYGEVGYVCQEIEMVGQVTVATRQMYENKTGYEVGLYGELGVAKTLSRHTYVAGALQGRRYQHVDGAMTANRSDLSLWLGAGVKW